MLEGVRVATGGVVPAPLNDAVTVPSPPFFPSVQTDRTPEKLPYAVGVKVTCTAHVAFAARTVGQLLLCANGPVTPIQRMLRSAVPLFSNVKAIGLLELPALVLGNVALGGVSTAQPAGALGNS